MDDELFHKDFSKNVETCTNDGCSIMKNSCGIYLFIDTNCDAIIRAVSICTSFEQRYKEHTRGSKLLTKDLYCRYPHDEVKIDKGLEIVQRGTWADLKLVFGVRWKKQFREEMVNQFHKL